MTQPTLRSLSPGDPDSPSRQHRRKNSWWAVGSLAFLTMAVGWLWRDQLLGRVTFFGNHDHLAYYLCNELFNYDSLRSHGHFEEWDERIFGGVDQGAQPAIGTNLSPLKLLMPWVSRSQLFQAAALVQVGMTCLAAFAAYLAVRLVARPSLAAAAAVMYVTSVYAQLNFCQDDMFSPLLVALPLGTWIISSQRRSAATLLMLTAAALPVAYLAFEPQAEYIVGFWGLLTIHRAVRERQWWPAILFAVALTSAGALCLPRLYAVVTELLGAQRAVDSGGQVLSFAKLQRFFNVTPRELWRALDDSIFGRFGQEAATYNNNLNLNEGFQIYSSTLATLLVLNVLLRYRRRWLGAFRWSEGLVAVSAWTLVVVVAVIFLPPASYLVYCLFLKAPFIHARVVIIGLLPMAVLAAAGLEEFWRAGQSGGRPANRVGAAAGLVVAIPVIMVLGHFQNAARAAQAVDASAAVPASQVMRSLWTLAWNPALRRAPIDLADNHFGPGNLWVHAAAAERIAVCIVLIIALFAALPLVRKYRGGAAAACTFLACLIVVQALQDADLRANGPQTRTYPAPFHGDNFFAAPPDTLRPPNRDAIERLHSRLHPEQWRVVFLAPSSVYFGFPVPVVTQLWKLRTVEGYLSGIPKRLAVLPWSKNVAGFRTISFQEERNLPWALLAALNVRYAVTITENLYFNRPGAEAAAVIENPLPVTPRVFFCARTIPALPLEPRSMKTHPVPDAPQRESSVEGQIEVREWPTVGGISADFQGDHIHLLLGANSADRFLVLNEAYHTFWQARTSDGRELEVHPVNTFMRGIVVPAGVTRIDLNFVPPRHATLAIIATLGALLELGLCGYWLRAPRVGTRRISARQPQS